MFNRDNRPLLPKHDDLFAQLGVPQPRTLVKGFGLWFLFSSVMGLGLLAVVFYVAWHFISKIW